ncbi:hypothetical protein AB0H64_44655 [Nonomuraea sp. NPDC050733]|uniref:hypothetical protein n=1 Tax=Nonomuraea sp. NPDC050733 TaxID=3154633 RepID=UPI0033C4D81A
MTWPATFRPWRRAVASSKIQVRCDPLKDSEHQYRGSDNRFELARSQTQPDTPFQGGPLLAGRWRSWAGLRLFGRSRPTTPRPSRAVAERIERPADHTRSTSQSQDRLSSAKIRSDPPRRPTPACPVCAAPIQAATRGRPAVYCGKPCRQAAHRARGRVLQARRELAWTRRRLQAHLDAFARLAAELDQAAVRLAAEDPGGADVDQEDALGAGDPGGPPSTPWEPALAELARRAASLATTIAGAARSHRATAADHAHAARIAGL